MSTALTATARWTPRGDLGRFVESVISPAAFTAVQQSVEMVVEEAKAICPVDTGELRDSISGKVEETGKSAVGTIVAAAPHAGYVEYGTGVRGANSPGVEPGPYPYDPSWPGMVARPFMRPALDATRQTIKEQMAASISLALKK